MSDVERQIQSMVPRRTPRSQPRPRSGLAPLPPAHPFVSKQAQAQQAVDQVLHPQHTRSLLGQVSDTITGAPKGLVHLVKGVGVGAIALPRIAYDAARGQTGPGNRFADKYLGLLPELVKGGEQTIGRVAQLSPFEVHSVGGTKIQTYGDLVRNGQIVSGLLNDVGNVAAGAGAASKGLGMAAGLAEDAGAARLAEGLGSAAQRAHGIAHLGGEVANAPFKPYQMAARTGRSLVGRVLDTGATAADAIGAEAQGAQLGGLSEATRVADPNASVLRRFGQEGKALAESTLKGFAAKPGREKLAEHGSMFLTSEGKRLKGAVRDARINPARFTRYERNRLVRVSKVATKDAPSLAEQEAAAAILNGVGRPDFEASKQLGAEGALGSHTPDVRPGTTLTPAGQPLVHAYYAGTLPADQLGRIQNVMRAEGEAVGRRTKSALSGRGQAHALDPAYLGDEPLDQQVGVALSGLTKPAPTLTDPNAVAPMFPAHMMDSLQNLRETLGTPDRPAPWDQVAEHLQGTPMGEALDKVLLDPHIYPTAWREAMNVTGKATEAGAIGLPRKPSEMLAAGWERPTYLPSPDLAPIERTRQVATTEGFGSGVRGVGSEKHRATLGTGPYSLATFAESLNRGIRQTEFNHSLLQFVLHDETKSVGDLLQSEPRIAQTLSDAEQELTATAPDPVTALEQIAQARVENRNKFGGMTKGAVKQATKDEFGILLHDEMKARHMDVLPGDRADPGVGDFNMGGDVDKRQVGLNTVALPAGLKERAIKGSVPKGRNDVLAGLDFVHSKLKGSVLAYSTRWQLGDAIGTQLMSWVGGGINPVKLSKSMVDFSKLGPEAREALTNHPEFVESGLRSQDIAQHFDPSLTEPAPKFGRGLVKGKSFKLNQFINETGRHGYMLAKVDRLLKERGLDSSKAMGEDSAAWQNPEVQKAIGEAINDSNRVFGTIDDMTPFEQRVVKNIAWFWPWTRHITMLALRTAVDNPARILWTMRLGALGSDPNSDLPEFLRGAFKGPGGYWSPNFLNPINDVGSGNLLSADAGLRQLSPVWKLAINAGLNRDANRNLNVITHRPGTHPNPFVSALYQASQVSPVTRGLMGLAPTGELGQFGFGPHPRYGSGQTVLDKAGQPIADTGRLRAAAIGLPVPYAAEQAGQSTSSGSPFVRRSSGLRKSGLGSKSLKKSGI